MRTVFLARLCALVALSAAFTGCAVIPHLGVFYSDVTHPVGWNSSHKEISLEPGTFTVLKEVRGEASVENFAGVFASGDYSVAAAYKDALAKAPEADMVIDVHVDQYTMRIVSFYIKATTIVTGKAIKLAPGKAPAAGTAAGGGDSAGTGNPGGGNSGGGDWWGK